MRFLHYAALWSKWKKSIIKIIPTANKISSHYLRFVDKILNYFNPELSLKTQQGSPAFAVACKNNCLFYLLSSRCPGSGVFVFCHPAISNFYNEHTPSPTPRRTGSQEGNSYTLSWQQRTTPAFGHPFRHGGGNSYTLSGNQQPTTNN
jgi:hypothetical protein